MPIIFEQMRELRNDHTRSFALSIRGQLFRGHVTGSAQRAKHDSALGSDGQPRDGSVVQPNPQPSLGRNLQSPADAVSDDIGVTDDDVVRVLFLRLFGLGEVLLEGALDPGPVRAKLSRVWLPKVQRRFRRKRSAFLKQLVHGNGEGR